jgi:predicted PurR-regulated permease PerM
MPSPTEQQARILWVSLTALAVAVLLLLLACFAWILGWLVNRLSGVLLPLAVAGVVAYLLDPVVGFLERRGVARNRGILCVFVLGALLLALFFATLVPRLVAEAGDLLERVPQYSAGLWQTVQRWLADSPSGLKAQEFWLEHGVTLQRWLTDALPGLGAWVVSRLGQIATWMGLVIGFLLVPIYTFYFLCEKHGIASRWTDYVPLQDSRWKDELVFVLRSINDSMVVFFRGQVLVALCVGVLTGCGYALVGIKYALLLGAATGVLGIVPYLGVIASAVPALLLAVVQFGDLWHPLMVLGVIALVQFAEGWFISPRIIGDRVGMHPMTIIIAILVGTAMLGGILGGVLAIPLTAVLRTLLMRYVWRRRPVGVA